MLIMKTHLQIIDGNYNLVLEQINKVINELNR